MIKTRAERFSAPRLNCYARSKVSLYPSIMPFVVLKYARTNTNSLTPIFG